MNLIGERFFLVSLSYRYRVQCDRGFKRVNGYGIINLGLLMISHFFADDISNDIDKPF